MHVRPADVFRGAIIDGSVALIAGHNHPSDDPSPSQEDRDLTDGLKAVGELVGIKMLDHLVIGETSFYSFSLGGISRLPKVTATALAADASP